MNNLAQEKNTFKQADIRKLSAAEESLLLKHQSERVASTKLVNEDLTEGMGVENLPQIIEESVFLSCQDGTEDQSFSI